MTIFYDKVIQFFKTKTLRQDLIFVLAVLAIFRFIAHIPVPGVDPGALARFLESNQALGLLNLLTGGGLENFSIVMLGVGPYITASIIFQLLTMVVPKLEEIAKEGEQGQQKINRWTRWLTVPLAAFQAYSTIIVFSRAGGQAVAGELIGSLTLFGWVTTIATVTAGSILLMWLGELISERALGNGISLLIFAGIIASLPQAIVQAWLQLAGDPGLWINYGLLLLVMVIVVAGVVFITEGQRNIPIIYARQVRGSQMVAGSKNHLPLRVNMAGVIPIIFAISVILFPPMLAQFFEKARSVWLAEAARWVINFFQNQLYYGIIYFALVVLFTFFYTAIIFQPQQIAENLQRQAAFIPGIRPGKETVVYIGKVVNRILLAGSLFLGLIAVLPLAIQQATGFNLIIGGTSLLIVVSVVIESLKKVSAQLSLRAYE